MTIPFALACKGDTHPECNVCAGPRARQEHTNARVRLRGIPSIPRSLMPLQRSLICGAVFAIAFFGVSVSTFVGLGGAVLVGDGEVFVGEAANQFRPGTVRLPARRERLAGGGHADRANRRGRRSVRHVTGPRWQPALRRERRDRGAPVHETGSHGQPRGRSRPPRCPARTSGSAVVSRRAATGCSSGAKRQVADVDAVRVVVAAEAAAEGATRRRQRPQARCMSSSAMPRGNTRTTRRWLPGRP